eukprot:358595-Chlamydomonas_euryale.AAC.3
MADSSSHNSGSGSEPCPIVFVTHSGVDLPSMILWQDGLELSYRNCQLFKRQPGIEGQGSVPSQPPAVSRRATRSSNSQHATVFGFGRGSTPASHTAIRPSLGSPVYCAPRSPRNNPNPSSDRQHDAMAAPAPHCIIEEIQDEAPVDLTRHDKALSALLLDAKGDTKVFLAAIFGYLKRKTNFGQGEDPAKRVAEAWKEVRGARTGTRGKSAGVTCGRQT